MRRDRYRKLIGESLGLAEAGIRIVLNLTDQLIDPSKRGALVQLQRDIQPFSVK